MVSLPIELALSISIKNNITTLMINVIWKIFHLSFIMISPHNTLWHKLQNTKPIILDSTSQTLSILYIGVFRVACRNPGSFMMSSILHDHLQSIFVFWKLCIQFVPCSVTCSIDPLIQKISNTPHCTKGRDISPEIIHERFPERWHWLWRILISRLFDVLFC